MQGHERSRAIEVLSQDIFGLTLEPGRAEALAGELRDVLLEVDKLRSLDLVHVDPVVVFDPVKAMS